MCVSAFAQSNLPTCQGSDISRWNNCFGTGTSTPGDRYVGEWKNGRYDGYGTFFYLAESKYKGDIYVGEFRNGNRYGQGTYTFSNGKVGLGEWKDGKPHGQFIEYRPDKSINRSGIFQDGKFIREENINPNVFTRISPVQPIQQATAPNTEIEKRSALPDCQGGDTTMWSNCTGTFTNFGNKYVSEFKDGKMHGQGTVYYPNGSILMQGIWAGGVFIRPATLQQATTPSVQQSNTPNSEIEKLRAEAQEAKRKQAEAEEQLRLSQQQPQTTTQTVSVPSIGRRVALVVGNANYKVRPLKNPRNDADDISRSLRSSGFEVIDLRDASLQQMRNGVRQFGDRLINNDVGLVYFSGHGVEVKGRNYFIPVNADIMREDEIADQGLDVSLILEKMNTAGKGVNILIVDACRDDPFGRSFRSSSRGLAQMDAPRGTIIAYATSPGKVASDGDPRERNSPYTKNLVKAMQQPNKPIEQVFKEVRRAVQEETKNQQTPWENTSLSGDFYFKVQR